jgi:hypothetical protein
MVDWLVYVQVTYKLKTETLFLAVSILDRFLATRPIWRKDLKLVACTAAFIAAKFEEIDPPEVRDFAYITDQACRKEAILTTEVTMLTALEFCLCRPTPAHYIRRFRQERLFSEAHLSLLQYILELALMDLRMIRFPPSLQAAAAALLSSRILKTNPVWPPCSRWSERTENAVESCVQELLTLLRDAHQLSDEIKRKFSSPDWHCVSSLLV